MGEGKAPSCLPRVGRGRVRDTLSLDTEEAPPPPGRPRDRDPLAMTALGLAAVLGVAACSGGAASTPSQVQIARIKG
jgi:hypothetical protein